MIFFIFMTVVLFLWLVIVFGHASSQVCTASCFVILQSHSRQLVQNLLVCAAEQRPPCSAREQTCIEQCRAYCFWRGILLLIECSCSASCLMPHRGVQLCALSCALAIMTAHCPSFIFGCGRWLEHMSAYVRVFMQRVWLTLRYLLRGILHDCIRQHAGL